MTTRSERAIDAEFANQIAKWKRRHWHACKVCGMAQACEKEDCDPAMFLECDHK